MSLQVFGRKTGVFHDLIEKKWEEQHNSGQCEYLCLQQPSSLANQPLLADRKRITGAKKYWILSAGDCKNSSGKFSKVKVPQRSFKPSFLEHTLMLSVVKNVNLFRAYC